MRCFLALLAAAAVMACGPEDGQDVGGHYSAQIPSASGLFIVDWTMIPLRLVEGTKFLRLDVTRSIGGLGAALIEQPCFVREGPNGDRGMVFSAQDAVGVRLAKAALAAATLGWHCPDNLQVTHLDSASDPANLPELDSEVDVQEFTDLLASTLGPDAIDTLYDNLVPEEQRSASPLSDATGDEGAVPEPTVLKESASSFMQAVKSAAATITDVDLYATFCFSMT